MYWNVNKLKTNFEIYFLSLQISHKFKKMEKGMFERVSSPVLWDILAALPMEHLVRMARLGHETIKQASCSTWVTDRMANVNFESVISAYLGGHDITNAFISPRIMKRLNGKIVVNDENLVFIGRTNIYANLAGGVPGILHLHVKRNPHWCTEVLDAELKSFISSIRMFSSLRYITCHYEYFPVNVLQTGVIGKFPATVFNYVQFPGLQEKTNKIYYRPAAFNGRDTLDVLSGHLWAGGRQRGGAKPCKDGGRT